MAPKLNRSKSDPILTLDVICAWLIAAALIALLAVMGMASAPFQISG